VSENTRLLAEKHESAPPFSTTRFCKRDTGVEPTTETNQPASTLLLGFSSTLQASYNNYHREATRRQAGRLAQQISPGQARPGQARPGLAGPRAPSSRRHRDGAGLDAVAVHRPVARSIARCSGLHGMAGCGRRMAGCGKPEAVRSVRAQEAHTHIHSGGRPTHTVSQCRIHHNNHRKAAGRAGGRATISHFHHHTHTTIGHSVTLPRQPPAPMPLPTTVTPSRW
jgi:hypothetical protein